MISTNEIKEAIRRTSLVYGTNAAKLSSAEHANVHMQETRRQFLMAALYLDDNLCEMLTGRLNEVARENSIDHSAA